jgi:hypothetical protein
MNELYQTIHDLKKTIKALEIKVNLAKAENNSTTTKATVAKKQTV